MSRPTNILTAKKVVTLSKIAGRHNDGRNLHLYVKRNGNATWIFRYRDRVTQKSHDAGLGSINTVSLAMARQSADEYRQMLANKQDPIQVTKNNLAKLKAAKSKAMTFKQCVDNYIKAKSDGWRNEKHCQQWQNTIDTYCINILNKQISDIDTDSIVNILEPIWLKKAETARRVRQRIEAVIDWAKAKKLYQGENPARLKGHLDNLLAKQPNSVEHRVAVPYLELADFFLKLDNLDSLSANALKLQILTATRPNEATKAKWKEFNLQEGRWIIPAERMKAKREHTVPLSPRLIELLKKLQKKPNDYLFPSFTNKPITTAAVLKLVKEIYEINPAMTSHGFRSTFRDWAGAVSSHPTNIAEAALAHVLKDKTEAAYARDTLIDKRLAMMKDWEDYCYAKVGCTVNDTGNT